MSSHSEDVSFFAQSMDSNNNRSMSESFEVDAVKRALENIGSHSKGSSEKERPKYAKESGQRRRGFVQDGEVVVEKQSLKQGARAYRHFVDRGSEAYKMTKISMPAAVEPQKTNHYSDEVLHKLEHLAKYAQKLEEAMSVMQTHLERLEGSNQQLIEQIKTLKPQSRQGKGSMFATVEKEENSQADLYDGGGPEPVKWWIKR